MALLKINIGVHTAHAPSLMVKQLDKLMVLLRNLLIQLKEKWEFTIRSQHGSVFKNIIIQTKLFYLGFFALFFSECYEATAMLIIIVFMLYLFVFDKTWLAARNFALFTAVAGIISFPRKEHSTTC